MESNSSRKNDLFEAKQAFSLLSTIMTNKVVTITADLLSNSLHLKVLFKVLFFCFQSNFLQMQYDLYIIFAAFLKDSLPLDRTKAITWLAMHCTSVVEGEEMLDKDIQVESLSKKEKKDFFNAKARKPGPKWYTSYPVFLTRVGKKVRIIVANTSQSQWLVNTRS